MSPTFKPFNQLRLRKTRIYDYHVDYSTDIQSKRSIRSQIIFSTKFITSIAVTLVIVISQIFIMNYWINSSNNSAFRNKSQLKANKFTVDDLICANPGLEDVSRLAEKFGLDLVVVDPELLSLLEPIDARDSSFNLQTKLPQSSNEPKKSQEPIHRSILHLAVINETSGGQPNLKLFHNALNIIGYSILRYDDTSQTMRPEVYRLEPHLFEDMSMDNHKYSHDSASGHDETWAKDDIDEQSDDHGKIDKIYTEFITHIFILNQTQSQNVEKKSQCNSDKFKSDHLKPFNVIHLFVLYNYEYDPINHWIQPELTLNEVDKHKLLRYNIHSFDYKIPIEYSYIHQKRSIVSLPVSSSSKDKKSIRFRVFEASHTLNYENNTYLHCKSSAFNIMGLIDGRRKVGNHIKLINNAKQVEAGDFHEYMTDQFVTGFRFMETFSNAYGNFTYWITGSSLLAYHKYCDIFAISESENQENQSIESISLKFEIGLFSDEVNKTILEDLAEAQSIGVVMMLDWHKSNSLLGFRLKNCPNLIFMLYLYESKVDGDQIKYIVDAPMEKSSMYVMKKKRSWDKFRHHIFDENNLKLCWTRIDNMHPFKVPCNVHDHLRRIYVS